MASRYQTLTRAQWRFGSAIATMSGLLLALAACPPAHAVKNIAVDGHPTPVTMTVGETVTIRFEVQKAGDTVQFTILRDVNRTGKLNASTDYPFTSTSPVGDGGAEVDPTPRKVAFPYSFVPEIPAGQYLLYAEDGTGFASLPVTLVPRPEAQAISGRVTRPAGAPPKDAIIWAASDLYTLVASANVQPDGTYKLPVPPGTYLVFAEWFGNLRSQHQVVTVGTGQQVSDLNLTLLQGQEVTGTVRDGSQPVIDAVVEATSSRGDTLTMKTFRDGSYAFVVPNGTFRLTVRGVTEEVTVADQPLDGVDFPSSPMGTNPAPGTLVTVAGNGIPGLGGDGRRATAARLSRPKGIAVDSVGNLYMDDFITARVRKVDGKTGLITTLAGRATLQVVRGVTPLSSLPSRRGDGGPATEASLIIPQAVAVDGAGNVYIAETGDDRIRKVDPSGVITTVIRSTGPWGLALDRAGNLYIAEAVGRVRKRAPDGTVTTVAGGGRRPLTEGAPATSVALIETLGLAVDGADNLYIADPTANRILKVSPDGTIHTVVGNRPIGFSGDGGPALEAQIAGPNAVAVDSAGNLFFADGLNHRIRKIGPDGMISTVAGSGPAYPDPAEFSGEGGPATQAQLNRPRGVTIDAAGNLLIADVWGHRILKVVGAAAPALLPGTP